MVLICYLIRRASVEYSGRSRGKAHTENGQRAEGQGARWGDSAGGRHRVHSQCPLNRSVGGQAGHHPLLSIWSSMTLASRSIKSLFRLKIDFNRVLNQIKGGTT